MKVLFSDVSSIGSVRVTDDGFLVAKSRSARTGVQGYLAEEIGDAAYSLGFKDGDVVRVMRSESEVFSKDAMASITHAPVTIDHPPVFIDSSNWSEYSVGEVGSDVMRDGESLVVSLVVKDSEAVNKVKTSHKELSWGYSAEIREYKDRSVADLEMYGFKYNHISAVRKGRAGADYRIGDSGVKWALPENVTVKDNEMTVELKTVILGDKAVKVEASDADTVAAILKDHKAAIDDKDVAIGELKAKLAAAEAKIVSDEAMTVLVDAAVELRAKRDAVKAKFGDEAVKDASDAEIAGMFKVLDKAVTADDSVRKAISDAKPIVDAEVKIKAAQDKFLNREVK